jgi:uncharacterized membrane protein YkoI
MRTVIIVAALAALCFADSEKKIAQKDLPPAVQEAVKEQSKGAVIRGFTKEVEHGKTSYEAEMTVNGRSRDVSFDAAGKVVSIEEETPIGDIPSAAREAIQKAAAAGTLGKVEAVTENGETTYEATIRKGGKSSEFHVDSQGKPLK